MRTKRRPIIAFVTCVILFSSMVSINGLSQVPETTGEIPGLTNPMTTRYLKKNLRKSQPRLVLNRSTERLLKQKLKTDPVTRNMYEAIQLNANEILQEPLLERIQIGRRLLSISREMLYRMNMLGMTYRIDKDPRILARINEEIIAVCNFSDWNPSHYLDVGEMAMAMAMLESAFGTDFGHYNYPGFKESAVFKILMNTPSGRYYNFADCGDRRGAQGDITLAWFAAKSGNASFFEKERFLMPPEEMGRLDRLAGAALVWIAQYEEKSEEKIPITWKGEGANPVVIFTDDQGDDRGYYFGGKGGCSTVNHGNMNGGSFIFELNGTRWVVDPGNQNYHTLEKTSFNLWGNCQNCERWTLLTKNNFSHSTLTIDDKLHIVDDPATIIDFKDGARPEATIDLTATFQGQLNKAHRKFTKDSPTSFFIENDIETTDSTQLITSQLIMTSDVEIVPNGAILKKNGNSLQVENMSHPNLTMSIVSFYPAPLKLDKQIEGLKRVELRIPAWTIENGKTDIKVRLSE
ncbi:MAG: heparinase II/III domain-containing protein [Fermentimonas sp.]